MHNLSCPPCQTSTRANVGQGETPGPAFEHAIPRVGIDLSFDRFGDRADEHAASERHHLARRGGTRHHADPRSAPVSGASTNDGATENDRPNVSQGGDVGLHITVDNEDVGVITPAQHALSIVEATCLGGDGGRGRERVSS